MDLDNVACKADVHAAWRRKLNNKFSYSKQFGKFSKTNVYIYYVSGTPEGRFCMFFVIRRAVLGESWTPEGTLRARGPKSYKKLGKGRKNEGRFLELFGLRLAASGGSEPPRGRFGRRPGVCKLDFYVFCLEKRVLCNSTPLCSGSATFANPGAQFRATWAQKSESSGPKLQVRGARTVKFGWSVRSCWWRYGNGSEIAPPPPRPKSSRRYKSI